MRRNRAGQRAAIGALGAAVLLLAACDLGEPATRYDAVGRPTAGDIDADGDTDLVVGEAVLQNAGDGTFSDAGTVTAFAGFGPRVLVDVDGDGAADRLTAADDGELPEGGYVELADGDGGFGAPTLVFDNPNGLVLGFAVADVSGDGHVDIVFVAPDATTTPQTSLVTHLGDGTGAFGPAQRRPLGLGVLADAAVAADLDEDGDLDIVLGTPSAADQVSVFLNDGAGDLVPAPGHFPNGRPVCGLAVVDLDGDGHLDLAVGDEVPPGQLLVLLGDGTGSFAPYDVWPVGGNPCLGQDLVADITGDGHLDLVTGGVKVLRAEGVGRFTEHRALLDGTPLVAELDGDGRPDVVVVRSEATAEHPAGTYVYRNRL
jgi:hypothetical protein